MTTQYFYILKCFCTKTVFLNSTFSYRCLILYVIFTVYLFLNMYEHIHKCFTKLIFLSPWWNRFHECIYFFCRNVENKMCPQQNYCCWRWKSCNTVIINDLPFILHMAALIPNSCFCPVYSCWLFSNRARMVSHPDATSCVRMISASPTRPSQRWYLTELLVSEKMQHKEDLDSIIVSPCLYLFHSTGWVFFGWRVKNFNGSWLKVFPFFKLCHPCWTSWNPISTWPLHWPLTSVLRQPDFWTWWSVACYFWKWKKKVQL